MRRRGFGRSRLGVSLASRHLGESGGIADLQRTAGRKGPRFRGGKQGKGKKKLHCNRCSKNHQSFRRDEVGMLGEGWAQRFIRFYLSLNTDNQSCCLFPYQMLRGPELCHIPKPDHFSSNLSGVENILKTLPRKELAGESRRTLLDFHKLKGAPSPSQVANYSRDNTSYFPCDAI